MSTEPSPTDAVLNVGDDERLMVGEHLSQQVAADLVAMGFAHPLRADGTVGYNENPLSGILLSGSGRQLRRLFQLHADRNATTTQEGQHD